MRKLDDTSGDINPYRELIVNNAEKIETVLSQMEQWSILSNVVNYVQYDKHPKNFHQLNITVVNKEKVIGNSSKEKKQEHILGLDFGDTPEKLRKEYLDVYEGIQSEILNTTRFDEKSYLSTTYLERVDMTRDSRFKAEESFAISEQGYTMGKLLDGTECQILLDIGASKSFMSKSHYLYCKSLHSLPKFASGTQRIQVGNGQVATVLFIIPVIIDIHGHIYLKCTLWYLRSMKMWAYVLGIKNVFNLEGAINSWNCCFNFLNISLPIFHEEYILLKPEKEKLIQVDAPFVDEISGLAIIKILDKITHSTMILKLKFMKIQ